MLRAAAVRSYRVLAGSRVDHRPELAALRELGHGVGRLPAHHVHCSRWPSESTSTRPMGEDQGSGRACDSYRSSV